MSLRRTDDLARAGCLVAVLMLGACIVGCGSEGRDGGSAPGSGDLASSDAGRSSSGDSGVGPNEKTKNPGAAALASGRTQYALVPGGVVAKSPMYSLTMTLGQSPGGNASMSSPKYKVAPGIVGATQTTSKK